MSVYVTHDGDTHWLSCFADDPDAEHGLPVLPIDEGDRWDDLAAKVAEHRAGHGCQETAT